MVYLQRWHGWCHIKLLPSGRVLRTPYNHAPSHFMQSHIRKVYACLAVTCPPRFLQNDRDLLLATAVTRGWNGYRNKSQHRKLTLEKKILPPLSQLSKILYDKVLIDTELLKLQAVVYAILPSTTAVFSYAIGSRKLSANEQFFGGVQTVVSLLQTQIKQGEPFIATNKVYTSTNKTTIVKSRRNSFFNLIFTGMDACHVYVRALALGCFYSLISTRTFRRALTGSLDSCAEIKSALSVA